MMLNRQLSFAFSLFLALPAFGQDKLICPETVRINHPLNVSVKLFNSDCSNPVHLKDIVVSYLGNQSGGIGLSGPTVSAISGTIPPGICNFEIYEPGEHTLPSVLISNKIPSSLVNTLIVVAVAVKESNNKLRDPAVCQITVTN